MGLRTLQIANEFLIFMHQGEHHYRVVHPLPKDAKIINCRFSFPRTIELLLESSEWEETTISPIDVRFERVE